MENEPTFEEAMKRLEEIVQLLEAQDTTLEESVKLYREGAMLGKLCRTKLQEARHEMEMWQEESEDSSLEEDE